MRELKEAKLSPQGTKLAPLLLAILVNNLARHWKIRAKYYVDDLLVVEMFSVFHQFSAVHCKGYLHIC